MADGEATYLVDHDVAADNGEVAGGPGGHAQPTSAADQSGNTAKSTLGIANLALNLLGRPTATAVSDAPAQPIPSFTATEPPLGGAVPSAVNGGVAPPPGVAAPPAGAIAPAPVGTPTVPPSAPAGIDQALADFAPTAISAGSAALSALPMLASALAGLAGGGSGSDGGSESGRGAGSGGGSGSSPVTAGGEGLSPEAQEAVQALKTLAALYGQDGTEPGTGSLGSTTGGVDGSGAGADAVRAKALFQKNAARTFNDLDNDLGTTISGLAGYNQSDRNAIRQIIRDVNVALVELGPEAYTKAGRQRVHQILTAALQKALSIVGNGQANAAQTAGIVNRLSAKYLNGIAGRHTASSTAARPGNGRVRAPLDAGKYSVSSEFGPRNGKMHGGIDFAAPGGTPIYAATGGTVTQAGNKGDGYGYQVRVRAADGTETIYAHQTAGSIRVQAGDQIPAGTVIGAVGSTGNSTGNHLHYEVRRNGTAIDPTAYLASNGVRV